MESVLVVGEGDICGDRDISKNEEAGLVEFTGFGGVGDIFEGI